MLPSDPVDFDVQPAFLTAPNCHEDRRLVDAVYPWKSGKKSVRDSQGEARSRISGLYRLCLVPYTCR